LSDFLCFSSPGIAPTRRFRQNPSAPASISLIFQDNNFRNIRTIFDEDSIGTLRPALAQQLMEAA